MVRTYRETVPADGAVFGPNHRYWFFNLSREPNMWLSNPIFGSALLRRTKFSVSVLTLLKFKTAKESI